MIRSRLGAVWAWRRWVYGAYVAVAVARIPASPTDTAAFRAARIDPIVALRAD